MKPFLKAVLLAFASLLLFLFARGQWHAFKSILLTLIYALLFTVVLSPLCSRAERMGLAPSGAAALSVFLVVVAAALVVSLVLPYLIMHSAQLIRRCLPVLQDAIQRIGNMLSHFGFEMMNLSGLIDGAVAGLSKAAGLFARGSFSFAAQAGRLVFSLIIAYYALKERAILGNYLLLLVPTALRDAVLMAIKACKNAVMGYFSGVLKTSLFVGMATSAGLLMLGVSDALLLGLLMGILEMLPYIGPVLGTVPILLSAFPLGLNRTLLSLALVIIIQQAESSFIGPYFTASSTAIHPLTALLSVYILSSLFGIWGIVLAIPLVVTLQSVVWSLAQSRNLLKA